MAERLKDHRAKPQTIEMADAIFSTLAKAEIEMARIDAEAEAQIAKIKATADAAKETLGLRAKACREDLAWFIAANQELFTKPRKRKTEWGTYGLHTATKVNVFDRDAAILHCEINGLADCLKTTITLLTAEVKKHIEAGEYIPGCELQSGEVALCTVKKELLDRAKEDPTLQPKA
jgi:hypothetical protein